MSEQQPTLRVDDALGVYPPVRADRCFEDAVGLRLSEAECLTIGWFGRFLSPAVLAEAWNRSRSATVPWQSFVQRCRSRIRDLVEDWVVEDTGLPRCAVRLVLAVEREAQIARGLCHPLQDDGQPLEAADDFEFR